MSDAGSAWPSLASWHLSVAAVMIALVGVVALAVLARGRGSRELLPWTAALVLSVALLSSDVQATAMVSYRSHMIEHLVAILVIAPLVAAGMRLHLSRSGATLGLIAFTVLIPLYHLTRVGGWVMQQSGGHYVELASFVLVGTWFWLAIYGVNRPMSDTQRLSFTFIALPVVATTGLVLWSSDAHSVGSMDMSMASMTLSDVRAGGLVMIVWGTTMMLAHLLGQLMWTWGRRRRDRQPVGLQYASL
jgi:cytochrome c oxidase assembly factor CtaG